MGIASDLEEKRPVKCIVKDEAEVSSWMVVVYAGKELIWDSWARLEDYCQILGDENLQCFLM